MIGVKRRTLPQRREDHEMIRGKTIVISSQEGFRRNQFYQPLNPRFIASRIEEVNFFCLSHPVHGI
jgi:hypothetical protein